MGKNSKIIATVVPNGKKNGKFHLSVFLSPRLPDSGHLSDYYEILHWPEFGAFFTQNSNVNIAVNKFDEATNTYTNDFKRYDLEFVEANANFGTDKSIGIQLWQRLFRYDTPVESWILDEGGYKERLVYLNSSSGDSLRKTTSATEQLAPSHELLAAEEDVNSNNEDVEGEKDIEEPGV